MTAPRERTRREYIPGKGEQCVECGEFITLKPHLPQCSEFTEPVATARGAARADRHMIRARQDEDEVVNPHRAPRPNVRWPRPEGLKRRMQQWLAPPEDDQSRCAICGWALADDTDDGCVRGNCSSRPLPQRWYATERAQREYGGRLAEPVLSPRTFSMAGDDVRAMLAALDRLREAEGREKAVRDYCVEWQADYPVLADVLALLDAPAPAGTPEGWQPRIVCLCGSTRFRAQFEAAARSEGLAGRITLTVACFGHDGDLPPEACIDGHPTKIMLDDLHKRKIDLADEVLVINVGGYIGTSTRSEIAYAVAHNKPVRYLEPLPAPPVAGTPEET